MGITSREMMIDTVLANPSSASFPFNSCQNAAAALLIGANAVMATAFLTSYGKSVIA